MLGARPPMFVHSEEKRINELPLSCRICKCILIIRVLIQCISDFSFRICISVNQIEDYCKVFVRAYFSLI